MGRYFEKNEGITNVFQRQSVKETISKTIVEKYGNRTDKTFINISQTPMWRQKHHIKYINTYGIDRWLDKEENNNKEINIYRINVNEVTISQLKTRGNEILNMIQIKNRS